ncbi:hypothetical protein M404DRAFT_993407 [Pisolithus tinctorius Marx 270]|uniref:G domain-containing protein n=1 Tax=Pisolithus tinctorius Marx 270 TaxID=870435 RepID=A0A0C3JTF5_PISTI|nr:hypothetical protein M404DRAFT_993407 [Pisolithus tinctorius Marx 270]
MAPGPFTKLRNSFPFANRQKRDEVGDAIAAAASTGDVAGSGPTTTEATAPASSSSPAYHLNPERAKKYMKNITRFRILVIGRANAGKTTILQRVCNTVDDPEIFDGKGNKIDSALVQGSLKRGYHDIKDEFVFRSNPGFVFHDSCGFEAGSAEQFDNMKSFVVDCAVARSLRERIHAIWYCIPLTDYHRTVTAAELKFFNECDTGHVPVIVLLTKADVLNFTAMEELLDDGLEIDEAEEKAVEKERELLERWLAHVKGTLDKCKFPPKAIMSVKKMHEETADCTKLMQYTTNALNEEGLQMLLVSTQRSSIALCIEYAVQRALIPKMGLSTKDRLKLVTKDLEKELLSWFPNTKLSLEVVNQNLTSPMLLQNATLFGKFPTAQSLVGHAVACLLIFEHAYLFLQQGTHTWEKALELTMKKYKKSHTWPTISKAVKAAFQEHGKDVVGLYETIPKIIAENKMSI